MNNFSFPACGLLVSWVVTVDKMSNYSVYGDMGFLLYNKVNYTGHSLRKFTISFSWYYKILIFLE